MKLCYSTKFDSDDRDMTDIVCLHTAGEIKIYIGHCSPDAIETCHNKYENRWWKNSIYISFSWKPRENNG